MKHLPIIGGLLLLAACSKHNTPPPFPSQNLDDTVPHALYPPWNNQYLSLLINSKLYQSFTGMSYVDTEGNILLTAPNTGIGSLSVIVPIPDTIPHYPDTLYKLIGSAYFVQTNNYFECDSLSVVLVLQADTLSGSFQGNFYQPLNADSPYAIGSGVFSYIPLAK